MARLSSSCNAPKGHNQPQKLPRPQTTSVTSTKAHNSTVTGSASRKVRAWPATAASISDVSVTIVSCPCATQPMNTSVNTR